VRLNTICALAHGGVWLVKADAFELTRTAC